MKLNRLALCALAVAAIAVSCEDEADLALPEISADQTVLSFTQDGGAANAQTVYITSNRDWTASCDADWVIISPESALVSDEPVEVTVYVDANNDTDRTATITFETSTVWTAVTVSQEGPGGSVESTYVYSNDFDASAATQTFGSSSSSWPYLDQFDGWKNETGSGASTVSYNYTNMSVRDNSNSNGSYSNYEGSGTNNLLFGSVTNYFVVQGITLPTGTVNYNLSFGSELYSYDIEDNTFDHTKFHVYISDNGLRWVELSYTFPSGDLSATWDLASTSFTVPSGTTALYIYFTADYASSFRLDDVLLASSSAEGTSIDFSTGDTTLPGSGEGTGGSGGGDVDTTGSGTANDPYTTADALAIINAGAYTSSSVYVSGIIAGDPDIDTGYGNATYYISDDGTEADKLEVFRGYYLGGEKFTSTDQIKAGDEVIVYGELTMYYETPEITTGSQLYYLNGETSGGGNSGDIDLSDPYATNMTWTTDSNSYNETATINGSSTVYDIIRVGKSGEVGKASGTIPAGSIGISFYCVAWNGGGPAPFKVTVGDTEYSGDDYYAAAHSGLAGSDKPYAITDVTSDDYWLITFDSALTSDTAVTLETVSSSYPRVAFIGFRYFDSLDNAGGGDNGNGGGDGGDVETTGDGTESNPYTSDDVYALYNAGSLPSDEVYVKGVVCEWGSYSSQYEDMIYYISDDGSNSGNRVEIYNGYGVDGENVTYDNYLHVGDKVVVCGTLTYYSSYSIIEFSAGSKITSLEQTDYCDVSASTITVGSEAGSTTFTVSSNISWTASSDNSAFTVSPTSGSSGETTVTVSYTANTGSSRTAVITVSSSAGDKTVTVSQNSANQKTVAWTSVGSSYQTWSEDTHSTYGAGYTATQDGMTVGYYKGNYANDLSAPQTNHIRVYKAAELIIDVADATKITKVVLTLIKDYTYDIVVDSGTTTVDADNYIVTWEGSVSEFDANTANGQLRIYGIEVTYE